jgi:hypothetical protein
MKLGYGIVALVAAAASFGIATATTGASPTRPHHFHAAPGDSITVRSVDLLCHVYPNGPTGKEYSPSMVCVRASKPASSRAFGASLNYGWYSNYSGLRERSGRHSEPRRNTTGLTAVFRGRIGPRIGRSTEWT